MKMGTSLSSVSQYNTLFNLLRAQRPQLYLPSHMSHSVQQTGGHKTQLPAPTNISAYRLVSARRARLRRSDPSRHQRLRAKV